MKKMRDYEEKPIKPRRSILSVPGNSLKMIDKAAGLNMDQVMLDLEDSVPVTEKEQARKIVCSALQEIDWAQKIRSFRINGLDTCFAYKDIITVLENALDYVDSLVIPKVNNACDVYMIDRLVDQIEKGLRSEKRVHLEASIESAEGLLNVAEIARASDRLETLIFGISDYSASVGMMNLGISSHGDQEELYPGHRYHYPLSRMVMAAKTAGLLAIDAPYGNFKDTKGLRKSCYMAIALGCDGKWAIHPNQLDTINRVFLPSEEEVSQAKKVLDIYKTTELQKHGAFAIDGRMIDGASLRNARRIYEKAKAFGMLGDV